MRKISCDQAAAILIDCIETCDTDELADIFGDVFGYDVTIDENEDFVCKPNKDCGFILEQPGGKHYVSPHDD